MSQQDDIKAFNKYCAEVMCYETHTFSDKYLKPSGWVYQRYDPYSNLNQLAEVFDKWIKENGFAAHNDYRFMRIVTNKGIATAMRQFIESTKGDK